jgi:tetratricopeptide (TPR) repeat protein
MSGDQRWRILRLIASAVAGSCMLVLLPISTNIATGGNIPVFLRHGWVSWTAVAVFGVVAVMAYVPQAQSAREVPAPKDPSPIYQEVDREEIESNQDEGGTEPESADKGRDTFASLYSAPVRLESLPRVVHGRDELLATLAKCWRDGGLVVLAGAGGMGKSTLARELVRRTEDAGLERSSTWEVSAATSGGLVDGLRAVAANLTTDKDKVDFVGADVPESPDQLWQLLATAAPGWLLIIDNADELEYLGRPGRPGGRSAEPMRDATGWIRAGRSGLVLVTSRHRDPRRWPEEAYVVDVGELNEGAAAAVLLDLAPRAGKRRAARNLAHRLGRLPLALRLAGLYLGSPYSEHPSFDAYRIALESDPRFLKAMELSREDPAAFDRMVLMKTWELSLDALAARGVPQARPMLRLLSCFAPGEPVPLAMLRSRLDSFLAACVEDEDPPPLRQVLEGLDNLGLIAAATGSTEHGITGPGIRVHAVVADTNRLHLIAEPSEEMIRTTAVALVATELDGLTAERPSAWANFRLLTPHLQALLINSGPRLADAALLTLAETTVSVAVAYRYMDRSELGIALLTHLLEARTAWVGAVAEARLTARQQLADLLSSSGRVQRAERIWRELLTVRLLHWPADSPLVLAARHHTLEARSRRLPWNEVHPAFHSLLEDEERALGAEFRLTLATRQIIAIHIGRAGNWSHAESLLRQVAADAVEAYGRSHIVALAARHNHVAALRHLGRTAEADDVVRRLASDLREALGDDHIITRRGYGAAGFLVLVVLSSPDLDQDLAELILKKGKGMADAENPEPALEAFDALIERFGTNTSPGIRQTVAEGMFQKAVLLREAGRPRDSVAVYDDVISRYDGNDSAVLRVIVAHSFHNKAISVAWDPDRSVDAAEQAVVRYRQLAEDDPDQFAETAAKAARTVEQIRASAPATMLKYASQVEKQGQRVEALDVLERFLARYGREESEPMQQLVADAMLSRAVMLSRMGHGDATEPP